MQYVFGLQVSVPDTLEMSRFHPVEHVCEVTQYFIRMEASLQKLAQRRGVQGHYVERTLRTRLHNETIVNHLDNVCVREVATKIKFLQKALCAFCSHLLGL